MVHDNVALLVFGGRTSTYILAEFIIGVKLFDIAMVLFKFAHLSIVLLLLLLCDLELEEVLVLVLLLDLFTLLHRSCSRLWPSFRRLLNLVEVRPVISDRGLLR